MPVRIVKDNPDEEVIDDNFNFDNPNNDSEQEENQGNGNQKNDDSSFDFGNLANMLFGGGGNRSNGNSIFSSLASMAISACVGYAISSFQNRGKSSSSYGSSRPSREDVEELYQSRMQAAELAMSAWSYAAGADRNFNGDEKDAIEKLLDNTISQLFPSSVANQEEVKQELLQIFDSPLDYQEVVEKISQNREFAKQIYQQSKLIVESDGDNSRREQNYLQQLAQDLGL
jgi:uncharacterized membrane protein YebE (DUF533 family)